MLIILTIFLTTAFANNYEKYHDLEDEKQELAGTAEGPENASKSNKKNMFLLIELNKHKLGQDVLEEEPFDIKLRRADDSSNDENEDERLKVIPLNLQKTLNNNKEKKVIVSDIDSKGIAARKIKRKAWAKLFDETSLKRNAGPTEDRPYFRVNNRYLSNHEHRSRRGSNPVEEYAIKLDKKFLVDAKNKAKRPTANAIILDTKDKLRKFGVYKKKQTRYTEDSPLPPASQDNVDFEEPAQITAEKAPETQQVSELLVINHINNNQPSNNGTKVTEKPGDKYIYGNLNTISKILSVTDEKDVFVNLEKLQQLNLKLMRRNEDVKVGIYMKVLKDLIEGDSNALTQYDWLTTTVQIQSALNKFFQLIDRKRNRKPIHSADIEILKYIIFNHNFSLELKGANRLKSEFRKREKVEKENKVVEESALINRVWLHLRNLLPDLTVDDGLNKLNTFLLNVEDSLYDLHEAIANVAKVTRFKHQNWFENIKELYLTTNEKHLLELLLHLSFSRLIGLIEAGCDKGLEKDFIRYMKTNKKESKQTLEEILFVLKILDEVKSYLE